MSDPVTSPRQPGWLRIVLFASLAMNLLVIGLAVGVYSQGGPQRHGGAGGGDSGMRLPFVAAMETSERRALSRELRRELRGLRPDRGARRARYERALALLGADTFDAAAFGALLEDQRNLQHAQAQKGMELLLAHITAMSETERKAYAERLREVLERGPRKGRKGS